jgi:hypothetical protein
MNIAQVILVCICLALPANVLQGPRGWQRIVPLHSTRADVERLLGSSNDPCKCLYKTAGELVEVKYASTPCKGEVPGWNVPAGTVLSLTVTPKTWQRFSELHIDESKYVKHYDDVITTYYTNRDEGIEYAVSQSGMIAAISYIPSTRDSHLRCSGFPAYERNFAVYIPFDRYSDISFSDEKARLDNFAAALHNELNFKGYIIAYAGQRAHAGEAQARANRAKNYLVNRRGIEAEQIVTIDGGHRETLMVELYLVPRDLPAPSASPTVAPSKVQIIKAGNARNSNRRSTRPRYK